jgi:ABC-type transporter Mla MlaB component
VLFQIEDSGQSAALQQVRAKLRDGGLTVTLDFSRLIRIDAGGLSALETLSAEAEERSLKIEIHSANAGVYKALKLAKIAQHFSFSN